METHLLISLLVVIHLISMTLNKHRSNLIPDVSLSCDGTIFVTDRDGTFPLRHGKSGKEDIRNLGFSEPEVESYRSYDPKRENNKARFKQRANRYKQEVATLSGTVSTQSSHSLGRRLRRSKSVHERKEEKMQSFSTKDSVGGSTGRGRKIRGDTPKITPEFADTLRKKKKEQEESRRQKLDQLSLNSGSLARDSLYNRKGMKDKKLYPSEKMNGSSKSMLLDGDPMFRSRRLHEERLPFWLFLVAGPLLLILGLVRVLLLYWHEYFCLLWTGALVLTMGITGAVHKARYLDNLKTRLYIILGYVGAAATLFSCGLVLAVLVPTVQLLVDDTNTTLIPTKVTFTRWRNETLVGVALGGDVVTWLSVALASAAMLLLLVCFFVLSAAMMAFSNHYDAAFDTTGECDHRGNPRAFSPMEQSSLGQATSLAGIVFVSIVNTLKTEADLYHYHSPAWCGAMVILAGFVSICYGKRPDRKGLGGFSVLVQLGALGACSVATIIINLNMVNDIRHVMDHNAEIIIMSDSDYDEKLTSAIAGGLFDIFMVVNVVFCAGVIFKTVKAICCSPSSSDWSS